jgi:membrane associated rhomboid family serine protease
MVFPMHDDNSGVKIVPGVTLTLITINVLLFFFWELPQGPEQLQYIFYKYGAVPVEYTIQQDLPPYVPFPYWYTLITMMFIHGNFTHLFGNMLYLWIFGDNVEQAFGHARFLLFYLICGIGATFFHIYFNPESYIPSVGASGAISGILAAYAIMFPHQKIALASFYGVTTISALVMIGFWVGFQILNAIATIIMGHESTGIAVMAHLGGFLVAIPLTLLFFLFRWVRQEA